MDHKISYVIKITLLIDSAREQARNPPLLDIFCFLQLCLLTLKISPKGIQANRVTINLFLVELDE